MTAAALAGLLCGCATVKTFDSFSVDPSEGLEASLVDTGIHWRAPRWSALVPTTPEGVASVRATTPHCGSPRFLVLARSGAGSFSSQPLPRERFSNLQVFPPDYDFEPHTDGLGECDLLLVSTAPADGSTRSLIALSAENDPRTLVLVPIRTAPHPVSYPLVPFAVLWDVVTIPVQLVVAFLFLDSIVF